MAEKLDMKSMDITQENISKIQTLFPSAVTEVMGEDGKVAIRNIRRDVLDTLKKMKTNKEVSEDEYTLFEKDVNEMINKAIETVDKLQADKEKDVMTV